MIVSRMVRAEARRRFSGVDAHDVERLLEATTLPMLDDPTHRRERDRVHLAIIKEADGNFERFARSLALAVTDWRDLLVAAGMANEDWPDVLRNAGFPVP